MPAPWTQGKRYWNRMISEGSELGNGHANAAKR